MSGFARRENFGGLWVKGVKAFLKIYCADWRELDDIKLTFLLDLNILPLKTDELISSFNYAGVLDYNGVAYKWKETPEDPLTKKAKEAYDRVIRGQILKIKKKEPEKLTPEEESKKAGEMTLYQETKARLAKEKPLTENEEIALGDRKLYKYYTDNCKEDNEEPLTYDLWLTEKYKEQDKTPQKAASEKVLPSINPSWDSLKWGNWMTAQHGRSIHKEWIQWLEPSTPYSKEKSIRILRNEGTPYKDEYLKIMDNYGEWLRKHPDKMVDYGEKWMTKARKRLKKLFNCPDCNSNYIYTTKKEHICRRCGFRWENKKFTGA